MTSEDLGGCCFLVTGASSGVGRATVRGLVARGAEVFGASRSGDAGDATFGVPLDLTDPAAIRRVASDLASRRQRLHGLVNAAGGMYWRPATTAFGVDRNWAVNYLGHALLTRELWPLLEAAPRARVATVAGNPRFLGKLTLDPARITDTPQSGLAGAGDAMSARVIWTHALTRKHAGSRVTAIAFHPGLVRSNLGRDAPWLWRVFGSVTNLWASSTCEVATFAATDRRLDTENGSLVDPARKIHHFAALDDNALGDRLWTETERIFAQVGV